MVKKIFTLLWFLCLCLSLTACAAASAGPITWLDQPLDGVRLPMAPLTIQVHASDEDGIESFEFFIDEQSLVSISAGGGRFSEASVEWNPPTVGTFTVRVHAVDGQGNSGPDAISIITIGEVSATPLLPATATLALTSSPTSLSVIESATLPVLTATMITPSPTTPAVAEVTALQNVNCRMGPSTVYQSIGFLLQGQKALIQGRNATSDWLQISLPSGAPKCWVALSVVSVSGDITALPLVAAPPPPQTATVTLPAPTATLPLVILTPIPIDLTPPSISFPQAAPTLILVQGFSCPTYARTTTVTVTVIDPGGVASVTARWSIGAEAGEVAMSSAGGGVYTAVIGPVNSAGNLVINVFAADTAGNSAQAGPVIVQVQNCIE